MLANGSSLSLQKLFSIGFQEYFQALGVGVVGDESFEIVLYILDTILMPGIYNKEKNYYN